MRLIVTGDWHLDAMTAGQSRLPEQREVLDQLIERVKTHCTQCTREGKGERVVVAFLGDLCNPDRGSRTLAAITEGARVFRCLLHTGATVVAIAGNHDVTDGAHGLTALSPLEEVFDDRPFWLAQVPRLIEFGPVDSREGPRFRFMFLPYTAPVVLARWMEANHVTVQQWVQQHVTAKTIVMGHLSIEGALLGSETLDMPRGRENVYPVQESAPALLRLNGHYHKRQSPHDIWCPGAPVRLAFGEENNPTGWLEWRL